MPGPLREALAFKAYEIEELADVYFFRPLGALFAYAAWYTPLTPNQMTVLGLLLGVAGGALLAFPGLLGWAFAVLILHSVLDSADGQLARLKNQMSAEGRVLDGVAGYFTHISIYLAILLVHFRDHAGFGLLPLWALSAACNAAHASMYDYHRNQYIAYGVRGKVPLPEPFNDSSRLGRLFAFLNRDYERIQRRLARSHQAVEEALEGRFGAGGTLAQPAREAYRRRYYRMVRGWNFLGDNTRFYAIGACAWLGDPEFFLLFNLTVMNLALLLLMAFQARADRAYLEDLGGAPA